MNKEYYTLKEVLFGLRNEQLRIEKELHSLEKMLIIHGNNRYTDSAFFSLTASEYKALYYRLMINYTLSEKIYNLLFKKRNLFDSWGVSLRTTKGQDGKHTLIYNKENLVKPGNKGDFDRGVEKILQDCFLNEIELSRGYRKVNIDITSSRLLYDDYFEKLGLFAHLKYVPKTDSLYISTDHKYRFSKLDEVVNELLNCKIPRNTFSEYIQSIIDNNDETKKEVIIKDRNYGRWAEFYVNDERNAFVLIKKK